VGEGAVQKSLAPTRRTFLQALSVAPVLAFVGQTFASSSNACFTIVNHWHQAGVGWYFREGMVDGKHYQQAYSIFYGLQKTIDAVKQFPYLTICLELDSHAYEAIEAEDKQFVREKLRPLIEAGRIDLVGGTYSQPYGQLVGWQSNVRQFVEGRAIAREVLGKEIDCFLVEEIIFYPQVPQLLNLCGFKYASLQLQNNGSMPKLEKAVVAWRGVDGSTIPTIPNNPWMVPLSQQNRSLAGLVDAAAEANGAMLTIWAEIWPPGLDWGASYTPYAEGFQSLHDKGLLSLGFTEYMRGKYKPGMPLDAVQWKMDDASFNFGWPQNKGALWETLGGWGYEGDALLKENRRLEHELNALEMFLAFVPDAGRAARLRELWKKLMLPQAHDCFIVSGYPGEYEDVLTTNLEVSKMMFREVWQGVRQLRQEASEGRATVSGPTLVTCQNPAGIALRQPIVFESEVVKESDYFLESNGEKVQLQRIEPASTNENPKLAGVAGLPSCGFKTYQLKKGPASTNSSPKQSGEIANEFYSVNWDEAGKSFAITDKQTNRAVRFRPFTGEIVHVKETWWGSPNTGAQFRAKDFGEVSYASEVEAAGPIYHALAVRGEILTFTTTEDAGAWVTARAVLYNGIRRVDLFSELHTYPRMDFRALAELDIPTDEGTVVRDFPFGEEESHNDQFSSLNYVRLQSKDSAVVLAHGGTQQFFCVRTPGHVVLKNMVARLTLKGSYRWNWSLTTGSSFTPAESYRFAEASWGPIVHARGGPRTRDGSWVSVNDPAVVIFRLAADLERITVWLMNYSGDHKRTELSFTVPLRSCRRVNMEGKPMTGVSATLDKSARRVKLDLSPWGVAALELQRS
jgi:hypothetical protein